MSKVRVGVVLLVTLAVGVSPVVAVAEMPGTEPVITDTASGTAPTAGVTADSVDVDPADLPGSGTAADPYIITNASELQAVEDDLSANYTLGADINASATARWNNGTGFDPIGSFSENATTEFTGTLDGNGYQITHLRIDRATNNTGLFGVVDEASITNISLVHANVSGNRFVGGVIGYAYRNTTIENISLVHANVSGDSYVGGINGFAYRNATIKNISARYVNVTGGLEVGGVSGLNFINNTVTGSEAISVNVSSGVGGGGLIGGNYRENIVKQSSASGVVTGDRRIGGLVGGNNINNTVIRSSASTTVTGDTRSGGLVGTHNVNNTIRFAYAAGNVTGNDEIGGLVGVSRDGSIINQSYALGDVTGGTNAGGLVGLNQDNSTIIDSYAAGHVRGDGDVGGLVGNETGTSTVIESYWDVNTTGQANSAGGATGLTTAQMSGEAARTNMTGLAFGTVWQTRSDDYPVLIAIRTPADDGNNDTTDTLVVDDDGGSGVDYTAIQPAIDNASDGDTVEVRPGTYNETVLINTSITLVGDPGGATTGPGSNAPVLAGGGRNGTAIRLAENLSGVTIRGFVIRRYTGDYPHGVGILADTNGTTDITISDTRLTEFSEHGIIALHGSHKRWEVRNNRIENVSLYGIYLQNTNTTRVTNNTIIGGTNVLGQGENTSYGIAAVGSDPLSGTVSSARIEDNNLTGTFTGFGGVVNVWMFAEDRNGTLRSVRVTNNTINRSSGDSPTRGINIYTQGNASSGNKGVIEDVVVAHNTISGVSASGVGVGGDYSGLSDVRDITITSNRINNANRGVTIASWDQSTVSEVQIVSNQIDQTRHDGVLVKSHEVGNTTQINISENQLTEVKAGIAVAANQHSTTLNITTESNTVTRSQFGFFGTARDSSNTSEIGILKNTLRNNTNEGITLGSHTNATLRYVEVARNNIRNNSGGGIRVRSALTARTTHIHYNRISENTPFGVRNQPAVTLNASYNYWGAPDGPSGAFGGSGDEAVGNVTVRPFYTDANLTSLSDGPTTCINDAVSGSDGTISLTEIQTAINWWAEGSEVPDTGGETISLSQIQSLINAWAEGTTVTCAG